jgi:hypothetical protein
MTSGGGPEGYCKQCGAYSQSRSIKFGGLCRACELETLHVRYGSASQICPVCKRIKSSDEQLSQQCILCNEMKQRKIRINEVKRIKFQSLPGEFAE